MSDTRLDKILTFGSNADRLAFTPDPPPDVLVLWYTTDAGALYAWNGSDWVITGGSTSASLVSVADVGTYFAGSNVETVLQEIGLALDSVVAGDALTANPLSQFAATTSAQLRGVITDETGTGALVFGTSPTLVTPALGTPTSGDLSSCTADGTDAVGFRNIPANSQSTAYTTTAADSGKSIDHPSTDANARTFTIDSNANVPCPVGTAISFSNMSSQVVTIAITADTMYLAGTGATGSRSLAQYGTATARKLTSTTWLISGVGLT